MGLVGLPRRADVIRVRAEHTAVARDRLQHQPAADALIEVSARVGRHLFALRMTAFGADDRRDRDRRHAPRVAPQGCATVSLVADRPLLHRLHNPHNYECGCDPDCWCRRTAIGRRQVVVPRPVLPLHRPPSPKPSVGRVEAQPAAGGARGLEARARRGRGPNGQASAGLRVDRSARVDALRDDRQTRERRDRR